MDDEEKGRPLQDRDARKSFAQALAIANEGSVPVFSDLLGVVLIEVSEYDGGIRFKTAGGRSYILNHQQDCCENVRVESITGDLSDLIGERITLAEEATGPRPASVKLDYEPESETWTFYKLATRKGYVDIRFFGTSNGYYSERVDFSEIT